MTKTKYKVKIVEILQREVEIEAKSEDIAIALAEERYNKEEIVLDSDDFAAVDFNIVDENEETVCPHCDTKLESKVIDVDGINLEEHEICPDCGYGTPALR